MDIMEAIMQQRKPMQLRVPDDLKGLVKDAATREGRSMNAQIVQHLREIYQPNQQRDRAYRPNITLGEVDVLEDRS